MRLTTALRATCWSLILAGTILGCGNASYDDSAIELPVVDSESHFVTQQSENQSETGSPDLQDNRLSRKIIYQAEIRLIVEELDASVAQLSALLKTHEGFVSSSSIEGDRGYARSSKWTMRVPVERFNEFRESILRLGEIEENSLSSEDVTGEFYDLKQRIENARQNEARLLEHLKESTNNLQEILTIEKELDRVRGDIERMQGRLKLMSDLSALTTVTVSLREEEKYTPSPPPAFASVVRDTFWKSINALFELGKGVIILIVGLAPWTPLFAVLILVFRQVYRRLKQQSVDAMM